MALLPISPLSPRSPLLRNTHFVKWGVRVDCAPSWWWLAAQFATLVLVCLLSARQFPAAAMLMMLGATLWPWREKLRASPRLAWLAVALIATVAAPFAQGPLAGLAMALLAGLGIAAGLIAFLPGRPITPSSNPLFGNTFMNRVLHKAAFGAAMALCIVWTAARATGLA